MADKGNKKMYQRRQKPRYKYVLFTMCVVAAALILGMSVFFRIKTIHIAGVSKYTQEEILAASGIEIGDNLLTVRDSSAAAGIKTALPYIENVQLIREWPSELIISVGESQPLAVIEKAAGGYYKITKTGKIVEEYAEYPNTGRIKIIGLQAAESKVGKKFTVEKEDELAYQYLISVLQALDNTDATQYVTWVNLTDAGNISFDYNGRFTVESGSGENIENKLAVVIKVAESVSSEKSGRIIVKSDTEASFIPNK